MLRVLKPGGIIVVAVPFSPKYMEVQNASYYGGFERRYDSKNLEERFFKYTQGCRLETHF